MPIDLGVLDTVISVVVVILLLSMIVQSVQTFIKKLLKFKSRQIRKSLEKLFDHVASSAPPEGAATADAVMKNFEQLGRVTAFGHHAIESISKEDLAKVVTSIEASAVVPEATKSAVTTLVSAITDAQQAADALSSIRLSDDSVKQLAAIRSSLAPIVEHVRQVTSNPKLLVRDVMSLGNVDVAAALASVTQLQAQVDQAAAADPNNAVLRDAASAVARLAGAVAAVQVRYTQVVARLRERVAAIDTWYDTVMLGFDERYTRHMRTWAFLISIAVTVFLNADLFRIYKRLATDDVAQQRVLAEAKTIQDRYLGQIAAARDAGNEQTVQDLTKKLNDQLDQATESYPALGIEPLDVDRINGWSVIGWLLMAALLSLGAPFWHDTLESLFGLKNFLRQKSDTKKVEQESGAGLTRT